MKKERWVIKTNQGRYVGIPYLMGGMQSFLNDKVEEGKTRLYKSEKEAREYLQKYLSPSDMHYVARYTLNKDEYLDDVEKVGL